MATLTTLTATADGTIGAATVHDAGTGAPFYTHCNDAPNGASSDWVANNTAEATTTANFALTDVNSDFGSMDTLNIDVDVQAVSVSNDTCNLTARIYSADAGGGTALTNETSNLATIADTTRTQRNVSFAGLTGTKANWDGAYIRFTWTYSRVGAADNTQVRLYGFDIDGTYTIASSNPRHKMALLGVA